jgi:hypothetical protein
VPIPLDGALAAAGNRALPEAQTYGKARPALVPEAAPADHRRGFLPAGIAAILLLAAGMIHGFTRGWLVLPFGKKRKVTTP